MNDQERENAINEFLEQDPTLNDLERAKIRNELLKIVHTDKEREEIHARTLKALEDTKKEMESDPPETQYFYTGDLEKLLEASDKGDQEATKKLLQLFSDDKLKEYIKTFKEFLELQPVAKELITAWRKAKKDGNEKKAESLKNELLSYTNIYTENFYINNSKVANKLLDVFDDSKNKKITSLRVSPENAKELVNVIANFDELSITGKPLTAYDRAVINAVSTIWEAVKENDIKGFTLQQVYRIMNGQTDGKKNINPQMINDIRESIDSCRVKLLKIDAKDQAEILYKNKKGRLKNIEGYLLPLEKATFEMSNGELVEGYVFIKCPILYAYSNSYGHVINVPIKLLDSSNFISNTKEIVVFRQRLIQRIETMKKKGNSMNNNKIRYDDIFENAGIDTKALTKTENNRNRDKVKRLLEHFINKKYIKGFEEYKEGRAIAGFTVIF